MELMNIRREVFLGELLDMAVELEGHSDIIRRMVVVIL